MRSLTPILFTFFYIMAMFRPVAPLFTFIINQDYIEEFLCINRDKPELECNGKCYLMQMLESPEEEGKKELPRINIGDYPIGFVCILALTANGNYEQESIHFSSYRDSYSYRYSFLDFHPPTFSA